MLFTLLILCVIWCYRKADAAKRKTLPFIKAKNTVQCATEMDTLYATKQSDEMMKKVLKMRQYRTGINEIDTYTPYKARKTLQYP